MKKKHELFYQEYTQKLREQYPSVAKADLPIPPVSPFLINITQDTLDEISYLVKLFYKMAHLKSYAEQIQTDKDFYLDTFISNSSLLMSYDFHLDQDNNLKLIEVNTHSSGYLISELVDQVQEIKFKNFIFSDFENKEITNKEKQKGENSNWINIEKYSPLDSLRKSFEMEWKVFSGQDHLPANILIADHQIRNQKMYIEFLMYKDLLNSWDWACELHEIKDLSVNSQGMLMDSRKKEVQMIYNRCIDFYFDSLPDLKKVFLDQTCCISPHPGEYLLLADKMRLCDWSSEDFLNQLELTQEERKKIKNALPFTAPVYSISKDELWKRRKKLFFKPLRGYGGKSVYRGKSISRSVFERVVKESSIFQEVVPPALFIDSSGTKWKYDIRAYVYKDKVQKLGARVYQGQLTQFQTPLSGFASINVQ